MRVRKVSSNDIKIHDSVQVKLKTAGNTSVVQFTAGNNKTCSVVNLSKDTYLDKKTGEVKQKKKSESRYQSPKSVRKSINRLMDLIRCNATDPARCKWLTVTYKDVMTDGNQAFLDAKLFLRKLKRYLTVKPHFIPGVFRRVFQTRLPTIKYGKDTDRRFNQDKPQILTALIRSNIRRIGLN